MKEMVVGSGVKSEPDVILLSLVRELTSLQKQLVSFVGVEFMFGVGCME